MKQMIVDLLLSGEPESVIQALELFGALQLKNDKKSGKFRATSFAYY